jgi:glycerol-3-phosphate acyltransferase PlsY
MKEALAIFVAYILGSIPTAYIAGRIIRGQDIRHMGGGNVGALNVAREIGLVPGILVLLADMGKGYLAVLFARYLGVPQSIILASGVVAVVGHNWSVFLGFHGGRGAATTAGVLLALVPREVGLVLAIFLPIFFLTNNVALGLGVSLVFLPLFIWLFGNELIIVFYPLVLSLVLLVRSLPSFIKDLRSGKNVLVDREFTRLQKRKPKD